MDAFTERHHAFISATYYRIMKAEQFPSFEGVFRMAMQLYAQQRGSRMAQRALRDGRPLDFASYRYYGEWEYTPQSRAENVVASDSAVEGEDLKLTITACPWSAQFLDMGLEEAATAYCDDLDQSIARGFNPYLRYDVLQTMHKNRDFCLHYQRDARLGQEEAYGPKDSGNILEFTYHVAHVYKTFSGLMTAIYKEKGQSLNSRVLEEFARQYGGDMAAELLKYRNHDFNFIG